MANIKVNSSKVCNYICIRPASMHLTSPFFYSTDEMTNLILPNDVVLDPLWVLNGLCGLVSHPLAVGKELVLVLPLLQIHDRHEVLRRPVHSHLGPVVERPWRTKVAVQMENNNLLKK